MQDERTVHLQVACEHLRHKLMYCDERHAVSGMVDDSSDTRVFFCAESQDVLGVDGEAASPTDCTPSRSCYCAVNGTG